MTEWLIGVPVVMAVAVLAIFLLARSDRRRYLATESQKAIGDRISDIRKSATFNVSEFERSIGNAKKPPELDWLPEVLEFYRRLESLAANEDSRFEDALKLAAEASQYLKQQRINGVFVAEDAERLAELLRARDAGRQQTT